jgi:hypothetical protein
MHAPTNAHGERCVHLPESRIRAAQDALYAPAHNTNTEPLVVLLLLLLLPGACRCCCWR